MSARQWLNERVGVRRYLAEQVSVPRWLWFSLVVLVLAPRLADLLRWLVSA